MEPIGEGNRQMKRRLHLNLADAVCALVLAAIGTAHAQVVKPVYLGNSTPKTDVLGRIMPGSNGNLDGAAAWMEIRQARSNDAIVLPPNTGTGEGNETFNPLLQATYMGHDVIGTDPGQFSLTLTNRFPTTNSYYARVYDKSTPSNSFYYANSVVFHDVPPAQQNQESTIDVVFQGWQRVDGEADVDSDGDGIPDVFEEEGGEFEDLDVNNWDTDGDGYSDGFEVAHMDYLIPGEPDPNEIRFLSAEDAGDSMAAWWSIPGVGYRLEYTDAMTDPEAFTEIWSGTASETNLEINVDAWVTNGPMGFFRWAIP